MAYPITPHTYLPTHTFVRDGKEICPSAGCGYLIDFTTPKGRAEIGKDINMLDCPIQFIICPSCKVKFLYERKLLNKSTSDTWYHKYNLLPERFKKSHSPTKSDGLEICRFDSTKRCPDINACKNCKFNKCSHRYTSVRKDSFGGVCNDCGTNLDGDEMSQQHIANFEFGAVGYDSLNSPPTQAPAKITKERGFKKDPELHKYFKSSIRCGDKLTIYSGNSKESNSLLHVSKMSDKGISYTTLAPEDKAGNLGQATWKYIKDNICKYPVELRRDEANKEAYERVKDKFPVGMIVTFQWVYSPKDGSHRIIKGKIREHVPNTDIKILMIEENGIPVENSDALFARTSWTNFEKGYIDPTTNTSLNDEYETEAHCWFLKQGFKKDYKVTLFEYFDAYDKIEYVLGYIGLKGSTMSIYEEDNSYETQKSLTYREFYLRYICANTEYNNSVDDKRAIILSKIKLQKQLTKDYPRDTMVYLKFLDGDTIYKTYVYHVWEDTVRFKYEGMTKSLQHKEFLASIVPPFTGTRQCSKCFKDASIEDGEITDDPSIDDVYCKDCYKCAGCNKVNHVVPFKYEDTNMFLCPSCKEAYEHNSKKMHEEKVIELKNQIKNSPLSMFGVTLFEKANRNTIVPSTTNKR